MSSIDVGTWVCPAPLRDHPQIVIGHGGGGKLSAELVEHLFLPAFRNPTIDQLGDSAILQLAGQRLAYSTDSYVVRPLFFPGGNIGELAVYGTVNDIAMSGAQPLFLSVGFILEEGMPLDQLAQIVDSMAAAARRAGVQIVTGDTKVVDRGHGDGIYINTSGFGIVPAGIRLAPYQATPGDLVIASGDIGVHGIAILSVREGLEFGAPIESDTAPLNGLVADMLAASHHIHVLRDPTRGGVASTLNEIAQASRVGIVLEERSLPVPAEVRGACELLGLDPLYIANEGKLIAFVAPHDADQVLASMHDHPLGRRACVIGRVTDEHAGMVVARTGIGGMRVVDMQVGEQLPRIC
jgi:hydrogenase expression/formation protein HypE